MMKKCPRCGKEKNKSEFNKDKRRKDGLSFYCRECIRKIYKEWSEKPKNREHKNKDGLEWYHANREEISKRRKKRRQEQMRNPEYKRRQFERGKEYRKTHKEQLKKTHSIYYEKHKEEILRKAKIRKKSIMMENILKLGGKCMRCGYDKYYGALDIHHLNPNDKEGQEDRFRRNLDYDKLVLLCSNCHRELHGGVWKLRL